MGEHLAVLKVQKWREINVNYWIKGTSCSPPRHSKKRQVASQHKVASLTLGLPRYASGKFARQEGTSEQNTSNTICNLDKYILKSDRKIYPNKALQIQFAIYTNTIGKLAVGYIKKTFKYNLHLRQIQFAIQTNIICNSDKYNQQISGKVYPNKTLQIQLASWTNRHCHLDKKMKIDRQVNLQNISNSTCLATHLRDSCSV